MGQARLIRRVGEKGGNNRARFDTKFLNSDGAEEASP